MFVPGGVGMGQQEGKQRERKDDAGKRYRPLPGRFWQFSFCSHDSLTNRLCANYLMYR